MVKLPTGELAKPLRAREAVALLGEREMVKVQRMVEMVVGAVKDEELSLKLPYGLVRLRPPHQLSQPILLAFMFRRM